MAENTMQSEDYKKAIEAMKSLALAKLQAELGQGGPGIEFGGPEARPTLPSSTTPAKAPVQYARDVSRERQGVPAKQEGDPVVNALTSLNETMIARRAAQASPETVASVQSPSLPSSSEVPFNNANPDIQITPPGLGIQAKPSQPVGPAALANTPAKGSEAKSFFGGMNIPLALLFGLGFVAGKGKGIPGIGQGAVSGLAAMGEGYKAKSERVKEQSKTAAEAETAEAHTTTAKAALKTANTKVSPLEALPVAEQVRLSIAAAQRADNPLFHPEITDPSARHQTALDELLSGQQAAAKVMPTKKAVQGRTPGQNSKGDYVWKDTATGKISPMTPEEAAQFKQGK